MSDQINHQEPRVLEYRKQVKLFTIFFKYFVFLLFVIFVGTLGVLVYLHLKGAKTDEPLIAAINSGIVWLFLYVEYVFLLNPLAMSKIQVFKDRLIIQRGKKETIVPFSEITQVKGSVRKSLGGWFSLVLRNGKSHRFTVVLERADYIIDAVIAFNPQLMDQAKYSVLRTNIILTDHGLARLYSFFGEDYRWITAIHLLFLPAGFAAFLNYEQGQLIIIKQPWPFYFMTLFYLYIPILILVAVVLTIVNSVIDRATQQRLNQFPENKLRDTTMESNVYRKVFPAYVLGLIGIFAVVHKFDLNTLSWTRARLEIPYMNIHTSELIWVDMRFNCLKCPYSLQRDDQVLLRKGGRTNFGKVVGIPGEVAQINAIDSNDRFLASTSETTIPEGKVAIRMKPDGSVVRLVNIEEIRGRITTDFSHFLYPLTINRESETLTTK